MTKYIQKELGTEKECAYIELDEEHYVAPIQQPMNPIDDEITDAINNR